MARHLPLAHDDAGSGPPLVLVHGFPHDRTLWRPQVEALAGRARLIVPDLPGFGRSAPLDGPASMDAYADAVAGLLDALDVDRAVVGGLSMGGYVALAFAERHRERLGGLVLASTRAGADTPEAQGKRREAAKLAREEGTEAVAAPMLDKMLSDQTRTLRPQVADVVDAMMRRQPAEGVAAALEAMATRPDRSRLLASIGVPALVVHGAADTLIPVREAEAMASALPRARLVVLRDAAHLPNVEQPQAFNDAVTGLLVDPPGTTMP